MCLQEDHLKAIYLNHVTTHAHTRVNKYLESHSCTISVHPLEVCVGLLLHRGRDMDTLLSVGNIAIVVWPDAFTQSQLTPNVLLCHKHFSPLNSFSLPPSPVQPNPPEKVSVSLMEDRSLPFLRVSWEPPRKADTRSGWITLIYEIRIKLEGENEWEVNTFTIQRVS